MIFCDVSLTENTRLETATIRYAAMSAKYGV